MWRDVCRQRKFGVHLFNIFCRVNLLYFSPAVLALWALPSVFADTSFVLANTTATTSTTTKGRCKKDQENCQGLQPPFPPVFRLEEEQEHLQRLQHRARVMFLLFLLGDFSLAARRRIVFVRYVNFFAAMIGLELNFLAIILWYYQRVSTKIPIVKEYFHNKIHTYIDTQINNWWAQMQVCI